MSVPSAELTDPVVDASTARREHPPAHGLLSGGRFYLAILAAGLLVGALSLLIPSTPSYDPWSWLIWGREILHLNLHTLNGPTWKPLPIIFTTIFALFGRAQPDLWLVVARAGAVVAALMAFRLTARLVWWLGESLRSARDGRAELADRAAVVAPAVLAGLVAMVALLLSGNLVSDSALGYSESLLTAATLIAVERHIDGHRHQAFALGFVSALDRPEFWLFWGAYGLWLMWKDPSSRPLVIGLAVLTLGLWFLPQKWGGGSFTSGVSRAHHPRANSAAYASCPFCSELSRHAWPLVLLRVKVVAALTVGAALLALGRLGVWRRRPNLAAERERALVAIALSGAFGLIWWLLVAIETQAGFSGNDRYLVLGSAFIEVAGGAGFGWAALALIRLARSPRSPLRSRTRRLPAEAAGWLAAAVMALVFVFVPNFVGPNLINIQRTHRALVYQARLRSEVSALINRNGGSRAVLNCGTVMTEGFQVPMVAWYLGVHIARVEAQPTVIDAPAPWPNVILQTRDTRHAALLPAARTILAWEADGARYRFTRTRAIYFFKDCRK